MPLTVRAVDQLLIVAGPIAAGKSTLLTAIREGRIPASLSSVVPAAAPRWKAVIARRLDKVRREHVKGLIVHTVLLGDLAPRPSVAASAAAGLASVVQVAASVTAITLWVPPAVALYRYDNRLAERLAGVSVPASAQLDDAYRRLLIDPAALAALYDDWFATCERLRLDENWIVNAAGGAYPALPATSWPWLRDATLKDHWQRETEMPAPESATS
jgi:hypothetical protein